MGLGERKHVIQEARKGPSFVRSGVRGLVGSRAVLVLRRLGACSSGSARMGRVRVASS